LQDRRFIILKLNRKDNIMLRIAEDPRVSNMKEVGLRIRALREKYNLPQEVFARKVLISRSNLSELENGKRAPTGPLLVALECLFSANKEWVLTGKGDMTGRLAGDNRKDGVVELVDGFRKEKDIEPFKGLFDDRGDRGHWGHWGHW
jgi:transcriptional regulator with XRE-family HTH domain